MRTVGTRTVGTLIVGTRTVGTFALTTLTVTIFGVFVMATPLLTGFTLGAVTPTVAILAELIWVTFTLPGVR